MREYATPLAERRRISEIGKRRYQTDPDFRLRCINRSRMAQGLPPRQSVNEIMLPEQQAEMAREQALSRNRAERGQFA